MIFPKDRDLDLRKFYGNPDANGDGFVDLDWEAKNIVDIIPPYTMFWSWNGKQVERLRFHKKCAKNFLGALTAVGESLSRQERAFYQLDMCGGAYNFRPKRGNAARLSTHAFGAAIDLSPVYNGLGKVHMTNTTPPMMPLVVVDLFKAYGLRWGGKWSRPDAMHFEAATA